MPGILRDNAHFHLLASMSFTTSYATQALPSGQEYCYLGNFILGCFVSGGSLTAVSIIGAAVLLAGKPEGGSWHGVLTMLSEFGGHPPQVVLAQIKTVMTSVLS